MAQHTADTSRVWYHSAIQAPQIFIWFKSEIDFSWTMQVESRSIYRRRFKAITAVATDDTLSQTKER